MRASHAEVALKFLPLQPASLTSLIADVHRQRGLPEPVQHQVLRTGALHEVVLTDAQGTARRTLVAVGDLSPGGLFGALHASRLLRDYPGVPVPGPLLLLPIGVFDVPAAIRPMPRGRPAFDADAVCGVIAALAPADSHGVGATAAGLHSLTASWAGDYRSLAERWVAVARAGSTAFQPVVDELLALLTPEALAMRGSPCLTPAELQLWMDGEEITAVDGWEVCWAGDRVSALGRYLHLDGPTLRQLTVGWFEGPLVARLPSLRAYAAGSILLLLARAAHAIGPFERVRLLDEAMYRFARLSKLEERLEDADADRPGAPAIRVDRVNAIATVDRLVRRPLIHDAERWLRIAGTVLWAHEQGVPEAAKRAVALLEPGGDPAAPCPRFPPAVSGQGPLLKVVAASLKDLVGGAPEGFDGAIAALSHRAVLLPADAEEDFRQALLGWLASAILGTPDPALLRRVRSHLNESSSPLSAEGLTEVQRAHLDPDSWEGESAPFGLILWALGRYEGDLPASVGTLSLCAGMNSLS